MVTELRAALGRLEGGPRYFSKDTVEAAGRSQPEAAAVAVEPAVFDIRDLCYAVGGTPILRGISARFAVGQIYGIIGPNGSGKSSLIRLLARQGEASSGTIHYRGRPLAQWRARDFAREVAHVPQHLPHGQQLTVEELVGLGRYPWLGPFRRPGQEDREIIAAAMKVTAAQHLADRLVDTLSGGERQRAWVAMMIAQAGHFLLLDEPTSALDIAHQTELLALLKAVAAERRLGIVMAFHDLNIASQFCDEVLALKNGALIASGTPDEIIHAEILSDLYGVAMDTLPHPVSGRPIGFIR